MIVICHHVFAAINHGYAGWQPDNTYNGIPRRETM